MFFIITHCWQADSECLNFLKLPIISNANWKRI